MQTVMLQEQERTLLDIVRLLPTYRVEQLMDFARFLETQIHVEEIFPEETQEEIDADNARWDALMATDEAQDLLENMAKEALSEYHAGKTRPMAFTGDGRIVPG